MEGKINQMTNITNNLIPMLSITGKPTKDKIYHSVDQYFEVGINTILLYPRDGLEIEYMSNEWFKIIGHFIARCKEKNMHIWLYDEFNWPSGSCKNSVQKSGPKFWQKCLRLGEFDASAQDNIYNPDGNMLEIISKGSNADILNPDAVDRFIELTHEQYYKHFGEYFGNIIVGIFTDEPSYVYTANGFENSIPYYDGMEYDYMRTCGRDMFEDAKKANTCVPSNLIKITNDLAGKRFREVYLTKIANWCSSHNIEFSGHFLGEEHIDNNGNILKALKKLSIPGIDDIFTLYTKEILQTYGLIQNASKYHNKAMTELFALGPCNMTYDKLKRTIWQAAVFGVTHYFLAIAHMDLGGNYKKCYYFNVFSDIQPNFEAMKLLCDTAKSAHEYAKKTQQCEVVIRYPRTKSLLDGMNNFDLFLDLLMTLTNMQVQWHIIDEDDPSEEKFILSIDNGIIEENTKTIISDLTEWISDNIRRQLYVVENGNVASDLIVRKYVDNDAVIINTADRERNLTVYFGDQKTDIYLPVDGVFVLGKGISKVKETLPFNGTFSFTQKTPGFYRAALSEDHKTDYVYLEQDTDIYFIVRNYKEPCIINFDGKLVETDMPGKMLHDSLFPYYRCSEKIKISAGKHKIELLSGGPEKRYLPICWLYGDFSTEENHIEPKGKADCYFGEGDYSAEIHIPNKNNIALLFKTNTIYSKVYIDDEHIADKVFTPQIVEIPKKFIGKKVKLTIKQFTSVAPLFGNVEALEKILNLDTSGSELIVNSVPEKCGIREAAWVVCGD